MYGSFPDYDQDLPHAADELHAALQALGIQASMSERGRPEERITSWNGNSIGVIDVKRSPISWVNMLRRSALQTVSGDVYAIEHGVPDSKITPVFPKVRIKATMVKDFPLFGEVVRLRWKGKDFSLGIIDYLNRDVSLPWPSIGSGLEIGAYPAHSCWILTSVSSQRRGTFIPSRQLWDCFQSIGRHLLATTLPPNT